mmetsp:Transcript_32602/g.83112  ORF Transcript_32602/g.83112 Transcript_32602/m.83112 type:complete len:382 (-) Transcript_32602:520-1665(-)
MPHQRRLLRHAPQGLPRRRAHAAAQAGQRARLLAVHAPADRRPARRLHGAHGLQGRHRLRRAPAERRALLRRALQLPAAQAQHAGGRDRLPAGRLVAGRGRVRAGRQRGARVLRQRRVGDGRARARGEAAQVHHHGRLRLHRPPRGRALRQEHQLPARRARQALVRLQGLRPAAQHGRLPPAADLLRRPVPAHPARPLLRARERPDRVHPAHRGRDARRQLHRHARALRREQHQVDAQPARVRAAAAAPQALHLLLDGRGVRLGGGGPGLQGERPAQAVQPVLRLQVRGGDDLPVVLQHLRRAAHGDERDERLRRAAAPGEVHPAVHQQDLEGREAHHPLVQGLQDRRLALLHPRAQHRRRGALRAQERQARREVQRAGRA